MLHVEIPITQVSRRESRSRCRYKKIVVIPFRFLDAGFAIRQVQERARLLGQRGDEAVMERVGGGHLEGLFLAGLVLP